MTSEEVYIGALLCIGLFAISTSIHFMRAERKLKRKMGYGRGYRYRTRSLHHNGANPAPASNEQVAEK